MDLELIKTEIGKINNYLEKCLWMDFELNQMSLSKIEIAGQIDPTYHEYAISIEFEFPTFISALFYWSFNDSKEFIRLANEEEFQEINGKYGIEKGKYLFVIDLEDVQTPFYIAASGIRCYIYDENPFNNYENNADIQ